MTEAYFYVDIPYHRPAAPSPIRLLQRWSGPLLLGTVLAAIAWHQDHAATLQPSTSPAPIASSTPLEQPEDSPMSVAAASPTLERQPAAIAHTSSAAHPSLVFHNCSIPHMDVKKDRNDLISGVATISSCDEAKVTLWDSSR